MKKCRLLLACGLVCALLASLAAPALAVAGFSDTAGTWAEDAIDRWAAEGVLQGDGAGSFNPAKPLTRAELAQILSNLLKLTEQAPAGTFSDVPSGAWYEPAILRCAAAGILKGNGAGGADPLSTVTRQEAVVMVARALSLGEDDAASLEGFADLDSVADWARGALGALVKSGVLKGVETAPGTFSILPFTTIDRASIAALLDRAVPRTPPAEEPTQVPSQAPEAPSGGGGGGGGGGSISKPSGGGNVPEPLYGYELILNTGLGGTVECWIDGAKTTKTNTHGAQVELVIRPRVQGAGLPYAIKNLAVVTPSGANVPLDPQTVYDSATGQATVTAAFALSTKGDYHVNVDFYQPITQATATVSGEEHPTLTVRCTRDASLADVPIPLGDNLTIRANGVDAAPTGLPSESADGSFWLYIDHNDADPDAPKLALTGDAYTFEAVFFYQGAMYTLVSDRYTRPGIDPDELVTVNFYDNAQLLKSYAAVPGAVVLPPEAPAKAGYLHAGWQDAGRWSNITLAEDGTMTLAAQPSFGGDARTVSLTARYVWLESLSYTLKPQLAGLYGQLGISLKDKRLTVDQSAALDYLRTAPDLSDLAGEDEGLLYVRLVWTSPNAGYTRYSLTNGREEPPAWAPIPAEGVTLAVPVLRADGTALADAEHKSCLLWGNALGAQKAAEDKLSVVTRQSTCTVTFVSGEGQQKTYRDVAYGAPLWMEEPSPREGFAFTGWYEDAGCTRLVPAADLGLTEGAAARRVEEDVTFYAGWLEQWDLILNDTAKQSYILPGGAEVPWNGETDGILHLTENGLLTYVEGYPGVELDPAGAVIDLAACVPENGGPVTYYSGWLHTVLLPAGYDREANPAGYLHFWEEVANGVGTGKWYASAYLAPTAPLTLDEVKSLAIGRQAALDVDWYPTLELAALGGEAAGALDVTAYASADFAIALKEGWRELFAASGTLHRQAGGYYLPWMLRAFPPSLGAGYTVALVEWTGEDWTLLQAWDESDYVTVDGKTYLTGLACLGESPDEETLVCLAVNWEGCARAEDLPRMGTVLAMDCGGLIFDAG